MHMPQGMGGLGGTTGDDDALESFLDSYLTSSFGTTGNSGFGVGIQQQQPQQISQQLLGGGLAGQPQMHAALMRPASLGQAQISAPVQGLNGMGLPSAEDTANMSIPALQALLRQRQLQQQQAGYGGVASTSFGQMPGMGGAGNAGLLRPTSLQDHLSGGMAVDHSAWRPSLGTLPSAAGMMQPFNTGHGAPFGTGEPLPGIQEAAFPNLLAPAPILRPASDSLLVNQKAAMTTPVNLHMGSTTLSGGQGHGLSSLRTNSLSAQTAAAAGGGGGGVLGAAAGKKYPWDVTTTPVAEGSDDSSEDDSSQRRRVKGRSASTSHQPSVQQEKNRSAQRRFRQRQKEKMSYLETRTETLSVQVDKLSQENESLRNMNVMLEKVLNLREEHISNLQEAAKVFSNLNLRDGTEGSGSGENLLGGGDAAAKTVQDAVAAAAAAGGAGGASGVQPIKTEESAAAAAGGGGGGGSSDTPMGASSPMGRLGGGHVLPQNIDGATARFTAEAIRSMSADDVIEAWKENLKELSRYVVLAENAPPGQSLPAPVVVRITSVTASMSELVHKVAMISPLNVKRLLATNMELHAMVPVPEPHWARVLLVLGLNERQRKDLLGARERFLAKFEAVVQERAAIITSLSQQAIPRSRVYADICSSSLAAHEATDRLRANLQREHNINMEFVVFVFRGVLDLLQIAKAAVHSYPYYPDVLAMSNVLHAQQPPSATTTTIATTTTATASASAQSISQSSLAGAGALSQPQPQPMQLPSPKAQQQQQHQQQQQQQQMMLGMPCQQQQLQSAAAAMGGLHTTGSTPLGAGVMFGTRVSTTTGLSGAGSGGLQGGGGGAVPAGSGGSCSSGGGLLGLSGDGGGMGMGMGSGLGVGLRMGIGMGMGMGGLASMGSTGGAMGGGGLLGFQQQQQQQAQQQQAQQQQAQQMQQMQMQQAQLQMQQMQQQQQDDSRMADS